MKKITPRQMEALESLLENGDPHMKRDNSYDGKNRWVRVRRAGGSMTAISDGLRALGFMSQRIGDRELQQQFKEYGINITAAGLQFIIDNSKYPALVELAQQRLPARLEHEAAIKAAVEAKDQARREMAERHRAKARAKTLDRFRQLFKDYGIGFPTDTWDDDRILQFAEQCGDAVNL